MIILINRSTKLFNLFKEFDKEYIAEIELGLLTDTWDMEGRILSRAEEINVSEDRILQVLKTLTGQYLQQPPVFSAKKINGIPAYKYLRNLKENRADIRIKPSPVNIYSIEMLGFSERKLTLRVRCGSGTYIRSLAFECGRLLGCGATLSGLIRTRIGKFVLENCTEPDEIIKNLEAEKKPLDETVYFNRCIIPEENLAGLDYR